MNSIATSFSFFATLLSNCAIALLTGLPIASGQDNPQSSPDNELMIRLRSQVPTSLDSGRFQYQFQNRIWKPSETAIIVCDFWDYHHCLNAVRRMKEFGPRLNQVINKARQSGMTIIHSPSDCMEAYADHPARKRVLDLPGYQPPEFASSWCSQIPSEEMAHYPIDQSDGGEDDDPEEHKRWAAELKSLGRNPSLPWKEQNDMIPVDAKLDFVTDQGDEVWNLLKHRKIKNVILVGVHTNMCVLGRPFGLRQMKRFGFNVALMRDMTDSMYNPRRWPFVNHFTGHDRVISHVEKFVCPTISSDQIIGGEEFSFQSDPRKHLVIVIGESEYKTEQTLPSFAEKMLPDFRLSFVTANPKDRNDFPDFKKVSTADLLLVSVRRRVLKPEQMQVFRDLEKNRKPIVGIRTASHAFSLRKADPPTGYRDWNSFDSDVFGGNYTNHYGNKMKSKVTYSQLALKHPITSAIAREGAGTDDVKTFGQNGSLYKTSPLSQGTEVLLKGSVLGHPPEPAAWTYARLNGGKSFYTSLGHPLDFSNPEFATLLRNAIYWAADLSVRDTKTSKGKRFWRTIDTVRMPMPKGLLKFEFESEEKLEGLNTLVAFRKALSLKKEWKDLKNVRIRTGGQVTRAWINGTPLATGKDEIGRYFVFDPKVFEFGEANWLTLGAKFYDKPRTEKPCEVFLKAGKKEQRINGAWEWMAAKKGFADEARMYLPAKFGSVPGIYVEF